MVYENKASSDAYYCLLRAKIEINTKCLYLNSYNSVS